MNRSLSRPSVADRAASWLLGAVVVASLWAVLGIMAIYMVPRGPAYVPLDSFLAAAAPPLLIVIAAAVNFSCASEARPRIRRRSIMTVIIGGLPLLWILIEFLYALSMRQ